MSWTSLQVSSREIRSGLGRTKQPGHRDKRRLSRLHRAASENSASSAEYPSLESLSMSPMIDTKGWVQPVEEDGTEATVFAVYDQDKTLQYIGFSKDLRNSLRTILFRRPSKAFFYRALNLPRLDQKEMLAIREQWVQEVGTSPPGLGAEMKLWQIPVEGGAISNRGRRGAAENRTKEILSALSSRGLKELFEVNQELLDEGQCDVLPSVPLTEEEKQRQEMLAKQVQDSTCKVEETINGKDIAFTMFFRNKFKTNGGYMIDLDVTMEQIESKHRLIVGNAYCESTGLDEEALAKKAFAFLLYKKVQRQTEGLMETTQFPINYFAISELEQWFPDFRDVFEQQPTGDFWRFHRVHGYGSQIESDKYLKLGPE